MCRTVHMSCSTVTRNTHLTHTGCEMCVHTFMMPTCLGNQFTHTGCEMCVHTFMMSTCLGNQFLVCILFHLE